MCSQYQRYKENIQLSEEKKLETKKCSDVTKQLISFLIITKIYKEKKSPLR